MATSPLEDRLSLRRAGRAASVGAALALIAAAPAPDASVTDARLRVLLPSIPGAAYFDLHNSGASPLSLTGASSPACGSLMPHRSVTQNGMDRMEMAPSVPVPAHGSVRFAPGGYHLMCMQPSANLHPGDASPVTLRFSGGQALTASFKVEGAHGQ